MAWIRIEADIWNHRKTCALCQILKEPKTTVVGYLVSLWHFVLENAWRDANLEPWGGAGIEEAARWHGAPGELVKALQQVGFLDGFEAHGWTERAGKLVADRLYNEQRRKDAVKRRTDAENHPLRDVTGRDGREQEERSRPNGRAHFIPPTLEEVATYCRERRNGVNLQKFHNHYVSNGWRVGKNSMKDWRAAVRTWEQSDGCGPKSEKKGPLPQDLCEDCRKAPKVPGDRFCKACMPIHYGPLPKLPEVKALGRARQ